MGACCSGLGATDAALLGGLFELPVSITTAQPAGARVQGVEVSFAPTVVRALFPQSTNRWPPFCRRPRARSGAQLWTGCPLLPARPHRPALRGCSGPQVCRCCSDRCQPSSPATCDAPFASPAPLLRVLCVLPAGKALKQCSTHVWARVGTLLSPSFRVYSCGNTTTSYSAATMAPAACPPQALPSPDVPPNCCFHCCAATAAPPPRRWWLRIRCSVAAWPWTPGGELCFCVPLAACFFRLGRGPGPLVVSFAFVCRLQPVSSGLGVALDPWWLALVFVVPLFVSFSACSARRCAWDWPWIPEAVSYPCPFRAWVNPGMLGSVGDSWLRRAAAPCQPVVCRALSRCPPVSQVRCLSRVCRSRALPDAHPAADRWIP